MRSQYEEVLILSAELKTNRHEKNRQLTQNLELCLSDCNLNFTKAEGFYNGASESCFVVVLKEASDIDILKDFAFKSFGQESILYQDQEGSSSLIYANGDTKKLGQLKQVNAKLVDTLQNYVIMNGTVYTTEL
jgi:hypothetical protein